MAAKKRIAFVANTSWSIYKFRLYLIERLLKEGFSIFVLAPRDAYTEKFEDLRGLTYIELIHLKSKTISPLADIKLYRELLHHYRTIRPDLIFHYTIKANLFGSRAAARAHIPSISVITGLGYTFSSKGLMRSAVKGLYRRILPANAGTWFLNEDDREFFVQAKLVRPEKTFLLPGEGVDPDIFAPSPETAANETPPGQATLEEAPPEGQVTYLLIGRLIAHKGIYEFVRAAETLKKQGLSVQCQILGFLDEHNPVAIPKTRIDQWTAEKTVTYLGHTDDVAPYIRKADCIVLPSYREGMPLSLLEGASMGKALIATDTPGCRAAVADGINGYLCRVKDAADLADKMARYYHLPPEAKRMLGREGRTLVLQKFTRDIIATIYLEKIKQQTTRHGN